MTPNIYRIQLKEITEKIQKKEFLLEKNFFLLTEHPDILDGEIKAEVSLQKKAEAFYFKFHLIGTVQLMCDRCLCPMTLPIETEEELVVKTGNEELDEIDGTVQILEEQREFDLTWYLYEFISLKIPIRHVHSQEEECDHEMLKKLKDYSTSNSTNKNNETDSDPRWERLKDIINKK